MNIKKFFSLNSPVRILYHFIRGYIAFKLYRNPARDMIVIGVTGTKGKTTTTNIITKGLRDAGEKVFMFSTVNYIIGDELIENNLKMTSPSPFVLQKLLKKAKEYGCRYAVIETSSHSIFYNRNYGIDFDVVVLTNVYQDHLDLHGTIENYMRTKLKLFENLVRYRRKEGVKKVSIVNIDSPYSSEFLNITDDSKFTYGLNNTAQVSARNMKFNNDFTEFEVKIPGNTVEIKTKLKGEFNIYNILAAMCVLISQRIPLESIKQSILTTTGIPGRLEEISNNKGIKIFVDYAHTEDSLKNVLETIKKIDGIGKIITVFGATGDRDITKRPKMGRVVSDLSDIVIVTDDDTYSENSLKIINDISKGIKRKEGDGFRIIPDREDAIRTALIMANKNDVLLLAGKGSETIQVTNSGSIPWSDVGITVKILKEIEDNELVKF